MVTWQSVLDFINDFAGVVAVGAMLFGVTAFIFSLGTRSALRALTRPLKAFGLSANDPERTLPAIAQAVESSALRIEGLTRNYEDLRDKARYFFQFKGLVRYDAFEDIGGQQSYSLCILDGNKDGVVLTYLTGRNSTRSYTVNVKGGVPSRKLSDEEARAMDEALAEAKGR
jgi:hypothetical protein